MALAQEFRFAARMLAKNKGWTAVAGLALALGLGANVAIFSVVGLMVWVPLPYPNAEQLAYITQTNAERGFNQASVSLRDLRDWAAAESLAGITGYQSRPVAVSGQGEPQQVPGMQVTPEFFSVLGVQPALGRGFDPSETPETESRSAVIAWELWQGTYQGDRGVLGREIRLNGRNYTIVGVMPQGFEYLYQRADVWTPLALEPAQRELASRSLNTLVRLKPGVSIQQANSEVRAISERLEREEPAGGHGWRGAVRPIEQRVVGSGGRAAALSMFGAVGFVLLIACSNVASLALARGTLRRREFALRASLGAGRGSLIRLQLAESLLLSVFAGAIGVLASFWSIPLLKRVAPPDMTLFQGAHLDWNALAFGLALSIGTGIVFGVVPAWLLTRGDLAPTLQDSSRGSTGGRHMLLKTFVVGEMALALTLVTAGTLMIRSLVRQTTMDPGFDKTNLVAGHVLLSTSRYPERTQVVDFFSHALDSLRRDASLESSALVQTIPLGGNNSYSMIYLEGQTDTREKLAGDMVVSPGYFQTMRIPLLTGRDFTTADTEQAPKVAIVNETFFKQLWPKEGSPIGRRLKIGEKGAWISVVGMSRDVRHTNITDPPRPEMYRPHAQSNSRVMMVVARGKGGPQTAAGAIRTAVSQVDREQPIYRLQTLDALLFTRQGGTRATSRVLGFLAAIALILAAVGTYGVMAYTAAQRTREIGIRLALGATQPDVFRMVLRGGLVLAAIGLAIGLPAAYAVSPLLRAVDPGIDPRDTVAYGGVAALLAVVALVACLIPAWRAMRLDPAIVLRNE